MLILTLTIHKLELFQRMDNAVPLGFLAALANRLMSTT